MSPEQIVIPPSFSTVSVKAFDVHANTSVIPAAVFVDPVLPGRQAMKPLPGFVFLIEHTNTEGTKRRLMFDLGTRKDQEAWAPKLREQISSMPKFARVDVDRDIVEQLTEGGIDLNSIDTVIWSHTHLDHVGDFSKWPTSTKLVLGAGSDRRGYPTFPDALLLDSDFAGRTVEEVDFANSTLKMAGLAAIDYLGDGSLYLIDMPGHCLGHLVALARVKTDSFILMGADTCHHIGQIRPTSHLHKAYPCPGHILEATRKSVSAEYFGLPGESEFDLRKRDKPLLTVPHPPSGYVDREQSIESQKALGLLDAHKDIFVVVAHDTTLMGVLTLFPETLNDWKEKKWKENTVWTFLEEDNSAFMFSPC
ncbi:hypothetical protein AAF712_010643 [Marasmius tenuissimus]|uniref:Metallo-beta-lactamase domain-containing protein n=1 Tax=Marasmius tenuissimus TaxID=585030 RepID=A0ABR2ZMT9_9AGAR|nr:hypothetical protein PM082_011524 [Marasmius tenuissimus]